MFVCMYAILSNHTIHLHIFGGGVKAVNSGNPWVIECFSWFSFASPFSSLYYVLSFVCAQGIYI